MKKAAPYFVLGFIVLCIVLIQVYSPKKINWDDTYEKRDKNPYGNYLLFDLLGGLFPDQNIEVKKRSLYEELDYYEYTNSDYHYEKNDGSVEVDSVQVLDTVATTEAIDADTLSVDDEDYQNTNFIRDLPAQEEDSEGAFKNYIILNERFSPGPIDAKAITDFVTNGNSAFIAAGEMEGTFADTLNLELRNGYYERAFSEEDLQGGERKDTSCLRLLNKNLSIQSKKYWYKVGSVEGYFSSFDTARTTVLGVNAQGKATFIKVHFGKGNFYISSTPLAFANYNIWVRNNHEYASACLSYLPVQETYWDEYYKKYAVADSNSLRFIESQPPLLWAYYLALWAAAVYLFFEAKRVQRVIPIVRAPINSTVEFVSTIGRMYFQKGDYGDLADKKIYYFLEYIRTNYFISTTTLDAEFMKKLEAKSGVEPAKIAELVLLLTSIQSMNSKDVTRKQLIYLSKTIDSFKKQSNV